jgi:hypothetical protein
MLERYVEATRFTGKREPVLMTNATAQHKSPKRTGIVSKHNQVRVNNKG